MDQVALVENQITDGANLIDALLQQGICVTAACWLKTSEDGQWYFYLASPLVDDLGLAKAYQRVHGAIRAMPQPFWIDPFEVKLISPNHPIAVGASKPHRLFPFRMPIRYASPSIGGVSIEGGYIYPLIDPGQQTSTAATKTQPAGQP